MKLVEHAIERLFVEPLKVDAEDIGERGAPYPRRHGVLRRWRDQPVERHHASQLAHARRQLAVAQNAIKLQTTPELMADMDRAGLPMQFSADAAGINFDQRTAAAGCARSSPGLAVPTRIVLSPLTRPINDVGDFGVPGLDQIALTDERSVAANVGCSSIATSMVGTPSIALPR